MWISHPYFKTHWTLSSESLGKGLEMGAPSPLPLRFFQNHAVFSQFRENFGLRAPRVKIPLGPPDKMLDPPLPRTFAFTTGPLFTFWISTSMWRQESCDWCVCQAFCVVYKTDVQCAEPSGSDRVQSFYGDEVLITETFCCLVMCLCVVQELKIQKQTHGDFNTYVRRRIPEKKNEPDISIQLDVAFLRNKNAK